MSQFQIFLRVAHHLEKIVPGQHDFALLNEFELQVTAHVTDDPDVHRDVRVLPSFSKFSRRRKRFRVRVLEVRSVQH